MREKISRFRRLLNSYHFAENKILLITSVLVLLSVPLAVIVALRSTRYVPRAQFASPSTLGVNFGSAAVLSAKDKSFIKVNNTRNYDEFENLTIEAYVKYKEDSSVGSYPILSKGFNPPNEKFTYFLEITPEGKLKFTYSVMYNGKWAPTEIVSNGKIEPGLWTHVAVVYRSADNLISTKDDGTIRLYINGKKDKEEVAYAKESKKIGGSSDNDVFIGMGPTGYESFNGMLDEVRLSSYPRYSGESFAPPGPLSVQSNTLLLFKFNQTEGNPIGKSSSGKLTTTSKAISYIVHLPLEKGTTPVPEKEKAVLWINPESGSYALGDNIDAVVMLDANKFNVDGVSVILEYDKQKLEAVSLSRKKLNTFNNYIKEEIDKKAGRIRIDAVVRKGNPMKVNDAPIETIRFKAIGEGEAQVRIVCTPINSSNPTVCDQNSTKNSLVSEYGVEGGSILTNVVNSTFRITGHPTPIPTTRPPIPIPSISATPAPPAGGFGKAVRFNAQGEGIKVDGGVVNTSWLTVEAWAKSDLDEQHMPLGMQIIINKRLDNNSNNSTFGISVSKSPAVGYDSDLNAIVKLTNGTRLLISTDNVLRDRKWHHLALVFDPEGEGNTMRFYVDGKLAGSQVTDDTQAVKYAGGDLIIGNSYTEADKSAVFYGEIDEVRISRIPRYNSDFIPPYRPFSDSGGWMLALYHLDGNAQDSSGNGNHGRVVGNVEFVDSTIPPFMPGVTLTPKPSQPPTIGMVRFKFGLEACAKPGADLSRNARVWVGNRANYATVRISPLGVTQPIPIGLKEFDLKVQPEGYLPKIFKNLSGLNLNNGVIDLSKKPISAGDADGSGKVNIFDYLKFAREYGSSAKTSDFDCSGKVNVLDYSSILKNWNKEISD
jgi:hypothetical protein